MRIRAMLIRQRLACALIVLLVLANVAAFSSRAIFIDEHIFVTVATDPSYWPPSGDHKWLVFGSYFPLSSHTHSPLGPLCLSLIDYLLGGFSEVQFRLAFGVFGVIAALAFYVLAQRFTRNPFLVTLLLVCSPAFFVISETLMMDIPMLACLLSGLVFYLDGVDGRPRRLVFASICFIVAVGFGYTALVPLGALFVASLFMRWHWQELASIGSAPLALALWLSATTVATGSFPLAPTLSHFATHGSVAHNLLAIPVFLGGVFVFPWSFLLAARRKKRKLVVLIGGAVAAALLSPAVEWRSLGYGLWFMLLASSGFGLLWSFLDHNSEQLSEKSPWTRFLVLWALWAVAFFAVVGEMINARYLLLALPAIYLVVFRESRKWTLVLCAMPTLAMSIAVAIADYKYVNAYRDVVFQRVVPLKGEGRRIWGAAESGLRFYLEKQGILTLAYDDPRPQAGDLVIRPTGSLRYPLGSLDERLVRRDAFDVGTNFPIRTFSRNAGAGFHDSKTGIVPFWFSDVVFEQVEVAEVVSGPPPQ